MSTDIRPQAPPSITSRLVGRLLPRATREIVTGDLAESFTRDLSQMGHREARRRYRRLAWRSVAGAWMPYWQRSIAETPATSSWRASGLAQDLWQGLRQCRLHPGHSLAVAGTLALGIAATAAVFGLMNAVMLKPLNYQDPDRVAFLLGWDTERDSMRFNMRYIDVMDLAGGVDTFTDVAVFRGWNATVGDSGFPERAQAYAVSANTFDLLGVPAALGRTITPAHGASADDRAVVLSHGFWSRRYGSDRAIVGQTIRLNNEPYTVLGVMPPAFEFPVFNFKGDLWTVLEPSPEWSSGARSASPSLVAIGRLKPDVTVEAAQAAASGVMARLAEDHPETNDSRGVRVVPMARMGTDEAATAFAVLGLATLLVLIVACTNAATLQLSRAVSRSREIALRLALGASRWRVVRQLVIESGWVAFGGGLVGAALTWIALDALRRALPEFVLRVMPNVDAIRVDLVTLVFTMGVAGASVVIFGLVPAWQAARSRPGGALKSGSAGSIDSGRTRLRSTLVVVQIAVSVALLVSTGLLARSASNLLSADPGFDRDRVLAFSVSLPRTPYDTPESRVGFFSRVADRLHEMPGVTSVGYVNTLPFSTSNSAGSFTVDGVDPGSGEPPRADMRLVNADYFDALGIAVRAGRRFTTADDRPEARVAIVNEAFVRRYVAGGSPLARVIRLDDRTPGEAVTIVGVVGDVSHWTLSTAPAPEIYLPYARTPSATMTFAVRTDGNPSALTPAVRAAVAAVDPDQAAYDVATLDSRVQESYLGTAMASSVVVVFGVSALVLTTLGLHGVLAFVVGRRTREIGVRVALGAPRGMVLRMVLRQSLVLSALGVVAGLLLGAAGAQAMAALLFGISPWDPASYGLGVAGPALAALVAAWVPARRALRVDPVIALRAD